MPTNYISVAERLKLDQEQWAQMRWQLLCELRVAAPGIIQSFDATKQTVSVQLAIREMVRQNAVLHAVAVDILQDVPIVIPRSGGFALTLPIAAGDECLVVFGDNCIDAWYQSGGIQNPLERRRHDLSDAFAVIGVWSQKKLVSSYSTVAAELRSEDGTVKVSLQSNQVTVTAPTVNVSGSTQVNISGGHTSIDGKNFLLHKHTGVSTGGGTSGPVL